MSDKGLLFVVSGPSGVGKDTIIEEILKKRPNARLSISATTRAPRPGDIPNQSYFFMDTPAFRQKIENGGFLEYAEYCGRFYGTPRDNVEKWLDEGNDVLLNIEVNGASIVKKNMPSATTVFVMPPSVDILRQRLMARKTETEEAVELRIRTAVEEMKRASEYDYIVVNGNLQAAVDDLNDIINAARHAGNNMSDFVKEVLKNA